MYNKCNVPYIQILWKQTSLKQISETGSAKCRIVQILIKKETDIKYHHLEERCWTYWHDIGSWSPDREAVAYLTCNSEEEL